MAKKTNPIRENMFRNRNGMKTMRVTPQIADKWLRTQKRNRKVGRTYITYLARVMTNGEWAQTGEPIKFDKNGHLIDGQNRLHALIECGKTIEFDVRYGLSPSSQMNMDGGKQRSKSDNLHMMKVPNSTVVSSICDNLVRWEGGHFWANYYKVTKGENRAMYNHDPDGILKSARIAASLKSIMYQAVSGTLHYLFSVIDADAADEFFARLADGAALDAGSPILLLRNRCIKLAGMKKGRGWGNDPTIQFGIKHQMLVLTIKAWNCYMADKTLTKLQMPRNGRATIDGLPEGTLP